MPGYVYAEVLPEEHVHSRRDLARLRRLFWTAVECWKDPPKRPGIRAQMPEYTRTESAIARGPGSRAACRASFSKARVARPAWLTSS
jgi:hypothetical protein